ncbi:TetR/AcrR family transcriptional regulator [Alicyclobacillus fodiniaquatilis]|uniref:TetR/AcrR family transcriptional regulator n=1 Tax=Alicyclobacillus fodiniaquatilis TaxID=1661150 RepID=A0ABW4JB22_9BACL
MDLEERVVEAAAVSFQQFGYKGTTMEQVARIANVGKGTIYTFFPSKEALYSHILGKLIEEMKQLADATIVPGDPFFTNLERVLRNLLHFRTEHALFVKLAQEARQIGTPTVQKGLAQIEGAIVGYIQRQLQQGIEQQNIVSCPTELVAFLLFRTYTAMVVDWTAHHEPLSDEALMQVFHQVFAHGLEQST